MTIIFLLFITLGQFIVCAGFYNQDFWTMIIGRFIFGIGGESLNISITSLIITWFQK
jgi:MFS family permease